MRTAWGQLQCAVPAEHADTEVATVVQAEPVAADVEVYCGIVQVEGWPSGGVLAIEVEVPKDSFIVSNIHVSPALPGLQAYLRRRLSGLTISDLLYIELGDHRGKKYLGDYHFRTGAGSNADFMHCVHIALGFAAMEFKYNEARFSDWMRSEREGGRYR